MKLILNNNSYQLLKTQEQWLKSSNFALKSPKTAFAPIFIKQLNSNTRDSIKSDYSKTRTKETLEKGLERFINT